MAYFRYQVIIDVNDPRCGTNRERIPVRLAREEHYNLLNRSLKRFLDKMSYVVSWGVISITFHSKPSHTSKGYYPFSKNPL